MAPAHRLVTLVFSHYNEKARWALDYCGIDYEERPYMPGFSQLGVMLATRGRGGAADNHSTRWSTPVIRTRVVAPVRDRELVGSAARWLSPVAERGRRRHRRGAGPRARPVHAAVGLLARAAEQGGDAHARRVQRRCAPGARVSRASAARRY